MRSGGILTFIEENIIEIIENNQFFNNSAY
jgi:hypothetical protein